MLPDTNNEVVAIAETRVKELALVDESQKAIILKTLPFLAIPYMPMTKEFIQDYVLNDIEYPLVESKISQAATEMRVRLDSLIDLNYQYQTCLLEREELEIDIAEIEKTDTSPRRDVKIKKKQLELQMKRYRAQAFKMQSEAALKELNQWADTVRDGLEMLSKHDPQVKTLDDVDFDKVRCAEMRVKIKLWTEMRKKGHQLSPSQELFTHTEAVSEALKKLGPPE